MGTPKIKGNTAHIKMASCRFDGGKGNCHMGETGVGHGIGVESGSTEEANVTLSEHLAKLSLTFEHGSKVHTEKQRGCSCIYSDFYWHCLGLLPAHTSISLQWKPADEWNGYTRIQRTSKKRQKPKVLFLQYGAWIPRDAIGNRKQQGSIPEELSRQTHKTCRDTLDQSVSGSADRREVISHRTVGGLA